LFIENILSEYSRAKDYLIFKLIKVREDFRSINISNKKKRLNEYFLKSQTKFIDF